MLNEILRRLFQAQKEIPPPDIIFHLPDEALEKQFIEEAATIDLINLKGHRNVGGIRASLYNAMPIESVEILTSFMKDFLQNNR